MSQAITRVRRTLWVEVHEELVGMVRDPTALFFSIAMPVAFFSLFASLWGDQPMGGRPTGTAMLATFGTFGVLGVALMAPGIGVAEDRDRGWLRTKKVWATPLPVTLSAKCLATVPYAAGVLAAMTGVAALFGVLVLDAGTWGRLAVVLVAGALPFGLLSLAIGLTFGPRSAVAVLQALLLPSAVVSGLWIPLEMLPETFQRIAPALPPYHLAQLGLAQLDGSGVGVAGHVAALLVFAVVAAMLAAVAYRRMRP